MRQYLSKVSHSGSPSQFTRAVYKTGQLLSAKSLDEQMRKILETLPDVNRLHDGVVRLEESIVQLRLPDVAFDKRAPDDKRVLTPAEMREFIKGEMDAGMDNIGVIRKYGVLFGEEKGATAAGTAKSGSANGTYNSSIQAWGMAMGAWWTSAQTRLATPTKEEMDAINQRLNILAAANKEGKEKAAIELWGELNKFWLMHTKTIAEADRARVVAETAPVKTMEDVEKMWRRSMDIYESFMKNQQANPPPKSKRDDENGYQEPPPKP